MDTPPHNFTHSPVDEVSFRFSFNAHAPVETIVPSPYPGWQVIREKITEVLETISGTRTIHSCMLRYTDVFSLQDGDVLHQLVSVAPGIPDNMMFTPSVESMSEISMRSISHNNEICIRFRHDNIRMVLVFEVMSEKDHEIWLDSALQWFDFAREDIHHVFDLVVLDELRKRVL